MALTYETFDIQTTGIITETCIDLPSSGKTVHFNLMSEKKLTKRFFTVINGQITPFENNTKMETTVKGINRLYRFTPHEGNIIVIDIGSVDTYVNDVTIPDIPFSPNTNQSVLFSVLPSIVLTFTVSDPEQLATAYCDGRVTDPLESVKAAVRGAFISTTTNIYLCEAERYKYDPVGFISNLTKVASDMSALITDYTHAMVPWIKIHGLNVSLSPTNSEAIINAANESYETVKSILKKFSDLICESYRTPICPPEISNILGAYISSNPGGITPDELESICKKLVILSKKASPEEMLSAYKKIGLLT